MISETAKELFLSVCIITFNEEKKIARALKSASFADELVVLDGFSTDRTREIAVELGASVHTHRFDGFVNQKNRAMSLTCGEWILVLDADEVITENLRSEILKAIHNSDSQCRGYRIPRMSWYLGRWIKHSGWYPDYNTRLVKRNFGKFVGGTVHERLVVNGPVCTMRAHMEHYSYDNLSKHLTRIDHYSTLIANDKFNKGRGSTVLWAIIKSISKFFITYVWRFGFLDGRAGLVIAVLGGYYNFLKYIKLWELKKGLRKPNS